MFLETGTTKAGLIHVIGEHGAEFAKMGVSEAQIPNVLMDAISNGKIVGYQGAGTGRPIYEISKGVDELEWANFVPLFWLCLFNESNIKICSVDNSLEIDESNPYAYLITSKDQAIIYLRMRRTLIEKIAGKERLALYDEWISIIESWTNPRLILRTEELSWMSDADHGIAN